MCDVLGDVLYDVLCNVMCDVCGVMCDILSQCDVFGCDVYVHVYVLGDVYCDDMRLVHLPC